MIDKDSHVNFHFQKNCTPIEITRKLVKFDKVTFNPFLRGDTVIQSKFCNFMFERTLNKLQHTEIWVKIDKGLVRYARMNLKFDDVILKIYFFYFIKKFDIF